MKTRLSYVSNSSSSSFVAVAYVIKDPDQKRFAAWSESLFPDCDEDDFDENETEIIVDGDIRLVHGDGYNGVQRGDTALVLGICDDYSEGSLAKMTEDLDDARRKLDAYSGYLSEDERKLQVLAGSVSC